MNLFRKKDEASDAGKAPQAAAQAKKPTHRAIATHSHAGQAFEMEIGAAWAFASKRATGLTVVLKELPPEGNFDLIEINPEPRDYVRVTSPTPKGIMPHLRVAVSETTGQGRRYTFIGDAWRSLTDNDQGAKIHVRLRKGTTALRFALFDAPLWKP